MHVGLLLFAADQAVPSCWRDRARPMMAVGLLPQEARSVLAGDAPQPLLTSDEEQLARLLVEGLSRRDISRRLGVSTRTLERRIASLRAKLGVPTQAALTAALAAAGFEPR